MASGSGRSSALSERHRSMVEARTTLLSRISRPGSAVDLILDRMGAMQADTRESMAEIQANMGAIHADTRVSIEAIHADIGTVHADTRNSIEAIHASIGAVHADVGAVGAAQRSSREPDTQIGMLGNIACA